jgi:hypothetical protein
MTGGVIEENTAKNGGPATNNYSCGGGIFAGVTSFTLTGVAVRGNTAEHATFAFGGGIYIDRGDGASYTLGGGTTIINNTARATDPGGTAYGGGLCDYSEATLSPLPQPAISGTLSVTGNEASGSGTDTGGGGIYERTPGTFNWDAITCSVNTVNDDADHTTANHN